MKKSLLIIDDDEEDHFFFKEAMRDLNSDVTIYGARSGELGLLVLRELNRNLPSLILLDLNMPTMNGFEVLRKIREQYSIPVVIHTTTCTPDLRQELISKGAIECFRKGTTFEETVKIAKMMLKFMSYSNVEL